MWIGMVSLFPEMFQPIRDSGITGRAVKKGILQLETWNPRDFTTDKHRRVDDKPYGGGPGMLMKVRPLMGAIAAARDAGRRQSDRGACPVIYMSPAGRPLDQAKLGSFAKLPAMVLVAGRYEGIDERLIGAVINEEVSIGDFILSGGEIPAMALVDGITRLLPGAVGNAESVKQDSFVAGLLEAPQYTRPEEIDGLVVPGVLTAGNHKEISRWRRMQALGRTFEKRPDLFAKLNLGEEERQLLRAYLAEGGAGQSSSPGASLCRRQSEGASYDMQATGIEDAKYPKEESGVRT